MLQAPLLDGFAFDPFSLFDDAFRPAEDFLNHMDNWIDRFKESERIDPNQEVLIPGEPEYRSEKERLANGIPLNPIVVDDLLSLGKTYNISL